MIIIGVSIFLAVSAALILLRTPKQDRDWEYALSRAPYFEKIGNDKILIRNLRTFSYYEDRPADMAWRDQEIRPEDISEIWFFIEPFKSWDAAAHGFMSFVFDGETQSTLSISVEARKEKGESYSPIFGMMNAYELLYVWSTEKDVMTRIAVSLQNDIYAYKLNTSQEQARIILEHFMSRTNALNEHPRFYNTLTSNCTNELAKAVNEAFPGALHWHYSHILTGRSAEHLYKLGFIGRKPEPFAHIKANAGIGALIRSTSYAEEDKFPASWRSIFAARQKKEIEKEND